MMNGGAGHGPWDAGGVQHLYGGPTSIALNSGGSHRAGGDIRSVRAPRLLLQCEREWEMRKPILTTVSPKLWLVMNRHWINLHS